jgi:hypothetical protein
MDITVGFKNGATFNWKNVRSAEVNSVFVDVAALAEKDEAARKAFRQQGKINGTKKPVRKVNKSK